MIYFCIFFSKCLENILSTIRIIEITNNHIIKGAILNGLVALTWVYSTINIVIGIGNSPLKISSFVLGCTIGSYIGSKIKEKSIK